MDQTKWNASVPKCMFAPKVWGKVDKFFQLIDNALDAAINAAQAKFRGVRPTTSLLSTDQFQQDRLRLKLYAFATIAVENDQFECNDEYISSFNTLGVFPAKLYRSIGYLPYVSLPTLQPLQGASPTAWKLGEFNLTRPFGRYDNRGALGNHGEGMGERYKGRGFVQLTGLRNYTLYGQLAGINGLATHPEQAGRPENAARILAAYLLHNQNHILTALNRNDFLAARKVVNGEKALGWEKLRKAYVRGEKLLESKP